MKRLVYRALTRSLLLVFGLALTAGYDGSRAETQEALVFGVRADAKPFSYHDAPPSDMSRTARPGTPEELGFRGYVVEVCTEVLEGLRRANRLDVAIETRIVNAENRFDVLRAGDVHILCDPATITPERLRSASTGTSDRPRYLNVSVPIYMSAVTVARPEAMPPGATPCRVLVGAVGETTAAPQGIDQIASDRSFRRWGTEIAAAMEAVREGRLSPTIPGQQRNAEQCPDFPVFKSYRTHNELAAAFCNDEVLYYVGDVEIVRAMLIEAGCADRSVIAPATFTAERYGIYTALPDEPVLASAILSFLAELSLQIHGGYSASGQEGDGREALLDVAYRNVFGQLQYQPSQNLLSFFWNITGSFPE